MQSSHSLHLTVICQVLMYFYQNDVLYEEVITSWYEDLPACSLRSEVCHSVNGWVIHAVDVFVGLLLHIYDNKINK